MTDDSTFSGLSGERRAAIRQRLDADAGYCRTVAVLYARQGKTVEAGRYEVFAKDFSDAIDLLAAVDQITQERDQLKFVLSFSEFDAREKLFNLLEKGVLKLTPDRKLVGGTHDHR